MKAMFPKNDSVMALGEVMSLGNQYNDILHNFLTANGYYGSLNDQMRSAGILVSQMVDVGNIIANVDGPWYDFQKPYLYTTSAGTTLVTTAEDPIGKVIDASSNGYHVVQATAAARPTYRVDANGRQYAAVLGTDDALTSTTGGGGSTGFFCCCSLKITGGDGTLRVIMGDGNPATISGYYIAISAANQLTIYAGNGAIYTTLSTVSTVLAGSTYVLTVWDNGTTLNVQINNATAVSVARPVVVAGTAGFTLFKHNTLASNYLLADVYHMTYVKNSSITSTQRGIIQRYAAAKAGVTL